MKKLLFIFSFFIAGSTITFAQCGKKVILTASKTTYLDSSGNIQRTVDEKSVIQITQSLVTININDERKMMCTVKSLTCNWSIPFKQGKTFIKGVISKDQEGDKNVSLDIEGKDGKIIILFKMEERPDSIIKVEINKFEEES